MAPRDRSRRRHERAGDRDAVAHLGAPLGRARNAGVQLQDRAVIAGAALVCWLASASHASAAGTRTPALTTQHFAFHSDFATNLNDALIAAGLARGKKQPELFRSGGEQACFDALPAPVRAGWDSAVDYYARIVSPVGWMGREQFAVRMDLVGFDQDTRTAADTELVGIVRAFLYAAGPAYRACRWPAQDDRNRRWLGALRPRLVADEKAIADRLTRLYRKKWKTLPIVVDVVETVDWSGANTAWSDEGQGDILISNGP